MEQISDLIKQRLLNAYPKLVSIYLFGSFGTKFQTSESDIDIAILSHEPLDTVEVWNHAQEIAIEIKQDVEIIDLFKASTVFRHQILTTGTRIFCSDIKYSDWIENIYLSMYLRFNEERAEIINAYNQKYGCDT